MKTVLKATITLSLEIHEQGQWKWREKKMKKKCPLNCYRLIKSKNTWWIERL